MSGTVPVIDTLASRLGHDFANADLLREALTHRSAVGARMDTRRRGGRAQTTPRGAGSNERLEFVGDRVLGLLMAEWLFERFPAEQEGTLGPRHAHLVSRTVLCGIAEDMDLPRALVIAPQEEQAGIRQLANVLADAVEALLGALYLDGGLEPARRFVRRYWHTLMEAQIRPPKDPKTALQEWLLGRGLPLPGYETVSTEGPSHAPRFTVHVTGGGKVGVGIAGAKRTAETAAAADLLSKLG
ncbi:ribonuclease III [Tanticharoenia sakaeratensis]|jgi:ribonuclease III|uniref:Ribonuclease 3 n=1 Tax=Tanticharoenia sakaeratensis NBRC 103193 TaxID=1231623 RepID=A0A0D6MLJ5_9PROT|nr:ribonuclease III [Tanticharoenia sakaeratensis]GAN54265.1 ribonuclease 3 [Tanticharoenia sakaeratensis NBRC 103193]GBQ19112.1 ribonuclease III [Tanticharoenia sakaeratensis NBRC 103193]